MNIFESIRSFFGKRPVISRDQARRLSGMSKDRARKELAALLYDHCVEKAAQFVNGELKRADSPYHGVAPGFFFHEVLGVTIWIMDREAGGGKQALLEDLQQHYLSTFMSSLERQDRQEALKGKYEQYEDTWNEITGHLDEFGLRVVQNLFGTEESSRTRERTFWIIQYADACANDFSRIRNTWKTIGVSVSSEGRLHTPKIP